eukprot:COSAG02_NODE_26653_length_628_cov_0.843100_1_plen_50_part_00
MYFKVIWKLSGSEQLGLALNVDRRGRAEKRADKALERRWRGGMGVEERG